MGVKIRTVYITSVICTHTPIYCLYNLSYMYTHTYMGVKIYGHICIDVCWSLNVWLYSRVRGILYCIPFTAVGVCAPRYTPNREPINAPMCQDILSGKILYCISRCITCTGWRRHTGCLKLQFIFRKRATNCRALLRKMTCEIRHLMIQQRTNVHRHFKQAHTACNVHGHVGLWLCVLPRIYFVVRVVFMSVLSVR